MGLRIVTVDAFTSTPFSGNPAAVVVLPEARDEAWMRHVAREMNLSETAFLREEEGGYLLRWFTPAVEVDLCGHATLASAHVLWEDGHVLADREIRFHTRSGPLTAARAAPVDGHPTIELDFPATPPAPCEAPAGLLEALGAGAVAVQRSRFDYLVEVESEEAVRRLTPDFMALRSLGARGIMVTARGGAHDVVSRFFAPGAGVDEDPVTGSAHCTLGPYWGDKLGKTSLLCHQASERGGVLRVLLHGDRVKLQGQAVTVMRGELLR